MFRTFHGRITALNWIVIACAAYLVVYAGWYKSSAILLMGLLFLVLSIERLIHTEYVVTATSLTIRNGRFSRKKVISLTDIQSIEEVEHWRIGGKAFVSYLLVNHNEDRHTPVNPIDRDRFVQLIYQYRQAL